MRIVCVCRVAVLSGWLEQVSVLGTGDSLSILDNEEGPFGPGVIPSDIVKQVDTRAERSK